VRIVFAGTPEFAVPCLRAAAAKAEVVAVYTQPDRPAGRGRGLTPSPVKLEAVQRGIPVLQPENFRSALSKQALRAFKPDLMVVVAYGLILPQSVLDIPEQGCWNVHASLLPRWRGAAPIQRAIEAGDSRSGVCLMQMEKGLDTGPVLLAQALDIGANETGGQLHDRLSALGAQVLADGLGLLRAGIRLPAYPQPDEGVTYAHKIDKAEARLDWSRPAVALANKVRAFNPWPMAEAQLDGERVRIHGAIAVAEAHGAAPGSLLRAGRDGIDIACGEGTLRIRVLQRDGGKAITAADALNGGFLKGRRDPRAGRCLHDSRRHRHPGQRRARAGRRPASWPLVEGDPVGGVAGTPGPPRPRDGRSYRVHRPAPARAFRCSALAVAAEAVERARQRIAGAAARRVRPAGAGDAGPCRDRRHRGCSARAGATAPGRAGQCPAAAFPARRPAGRGGRRCLAAVAGAAHPRRLAGAGRSDLRRQRPGSADVAARARTRDHPRWLPRAPA
jgi:methionyl-tRNA formyltransferase